MDLYRITSEKYLENYSGLGASYNDGARWNLPGSPVIYYATTASVAMLEMANYIPAPSLVPANYRLARYEIKSPTKEEVKVEDLPPGWDSFPHSPITQQIGSDFLAENKKLLLIVPSASVPGGGDKMGIFNPHNAKAKNIKLVEVYDGIYDNRIFSGK